MTDFPIAPVVGRNGEETAEIREFIASTEGVLCVRMPLTGGRAYTLVDREDWISLQLWRWRWSLTGKGYAFRNKRLSKSKCRGIYLHLTILPAPAGFEVDHKNGDPLDNRRKNLRPATHFENMQNMGISAANTTGIKGVAYNRRTGKFLAYIDAHGKRQYFGCAYDTPAEAEAARLAAAEQLHGKFARAA